MLVCYFFGLIVSLSVVLSAVLIFRSVKDAQNVDTWVISLLTSLAIVSQAGLVATLGFKDVIFSLIAK